MPTYPTNPALEAAVIANAEDDTPRLAYADWLDENGDPDRAAFIRTQVALWDKNPADEDYVDLVENREDLESLVSDDARHHRLAPNVDQSVIGFGGGAFGQPDDPGVPYHRGFPYFAREPSQSSASNDRECAERFRDVLPGVIRTTTLRALYFESTLSKHLSVVLNTPAAKDVSALSVENFEPEDTSTRPVVPSLLDSPARESLRWLDLNILMSKSDGTALAKADMPRLTRFSCTRFAIAPTLLKPLFARGALTRLHRALIRFDPENGAEGMLSVAGIPELHTLELWCAPQSALEGLAKAKSCRSLGRLRITADPRGKSLRVPLAMALAQTKFPRLASLELDGHGLRTREFQGLARAGVLDRLTELAARDNELDDQALTALTTSPCAKTLRILRLGSNPIGQAGLLSLGESSVFPSLTTLDLRSSDIEKRLLGGAEVVQFLRSFSVPGLRSLSMGYWEVDDRCAKAIAENPAFSNLSQLNLEHSKITAVGLKALVHSPYLRNLISLDLVSSPCEKGADLLADRGAFPNLRSCRLVGYVNPLRKRLEKARPHVQW